MCKEAGNKKRNSPCGKPAREKAFELHTVSEIILHVVLNQPSLTAFRVIVTTFNLLIRVLRASEY